MDAKERRSRQVDQSRVRDRVAGQKARSARLIRTVLLGAVAVIVAILWLGDQYGIEREETLEFLLASAIFVGGLTLTGIAGALVLWSLRRLAKTMFRGED